jgi:hypothetical protein
MNLSASLLGLAQSHSEVQCSQAPPSEVANASYTGHVVLVLYAPGGS